jgi:hypothetical protein
MVFIFCIILWSDYLFFRVVAIFFASQGWEQTGWVMLVFHFAVVMPAVNQPVCQ